MSDIIKNRVLDTLFNYTVVNTSEDETVDSDDIVNVDPEDYEDENEEDYNEEDPFEDWEYIDDEDVDKLKTASSGLKDALEDINVEWHVYPPYKKSDIISAIEKIAELVEELTNNTSSYESV